MEILLILIVLLMLDLLLALLLEMRDYQMSIHRYYHNLIIKRNNRIISLLIAKYLWLISSKLLRIER